MGAIQRQLEDWSVWTGRDDLSPLDGLQRAAATADATTLAAWSEENVKLLESASLPVRTRAIAALEFLPFEAHDIVRLLKSRVELFRDVEAEGYRLFPSQLEHALYVRLATDGHPDALPTLRERLAIQPPLAVLLASHDGAWLVENAQLVTRDVLGGVLRRLTRSQRARLLVNMAPWEDANEILRKPWWNGLEDSDVLQRIVAVMEPPPEWAGLLDD